MAFASLADQFFLAVTWLGSLIFLLPCSLALGALLIRSRRGCEALLLNTTLGLATLTVHVLKLVIKRPRPNITPLLVAMPTDSSFPSGHTAQAAAFFFALALIAFRALPRPAALLTTICSILTTLAVGYSRVYLGVHYVSDVVAGALVGGLMGIAATAAVKRLYR